MVVQTLSRLEKVELRKVFATEATDFTPWLSEAENLALLAETIGIELELSSQEKEVGPFRADILCRNAADGSWVLIENQLERTDHLHLGQLMTYAAGLEVATIVWIAERFVDEHRAAMDWLNEITGKKFAFFGLEVELYKIGDSVPAPRFNVVCKPNDWSKAVKTAALQNELTETTALQLRFWTAFKDYMLEKKSPVRCQKPFPQHWMDHSIGRSGAHLCSIASTWDSEQGVYSSEFRVELYLDGNNAKQWFANLMAQKNEIEQQLGETLTWHNPETKKSCRIYVRKSADFLNESLWEEHFSWLQRKLERFLQVFGPRVRSME
ncbi:MAG TPA: DUF4268 domain-containing protein [Negativicutes bacterium]|nr:DUF4268 domain-containing protein [Negativicutes bacterium]